MLNTRILGRLFSKASHTPTEDCLRDYKGMKAPLHKAFKGVLTVQKLKFLCYLMANSACWYYFYVSARKEHYLGFKTKL